MNITSVSIRNFVNLFPRFAKTINHFSNRNKVEVISGKAELLIEGIIVSYTHELSTGLFTVCHHGIPLHQQFALTQREVLAAFKAAEDTFFMTDLLTNIYYEDIPFSATDKGKRCKHYETSKKAIPDNERGQKERRKMRKATKCECSKCCTRLISRPISTFNTSEIERNDFYEFPANTHNSNHHLEGSNYTFLSKGMNVLIEKDGTVGALSFNPNYLGSRIIRAA
jgi:hypothetical protein